MAFARAASRRIRSETLGALLLCIAAITSFGVATSADAASAAELSAARTQAHKLLLMTNDVRDDHDLRPLLDRRRLARYATRHTARMVRRGSLFHSTSSRMSDALSGTGWSMWGENVGVGSTLRRVQRAFMHSTEHRANILRRAFDHAGIGVVRSDGYVWVTVDFYAC
jgi:uncharacterized protein YkwD